MRSRPSRTTFPVMAQSKRLEWRYRLNRNPDRRPLEGLDKEIGSQVYHEALSIRISDENLWRDTHCQSWVSVRVCIAQIVYPTTDSPWNMNCQSPIITPNPQSNIDENIYPVPRILTSDLLSCIMKELICWAHARSPLVIVEILKWGTPVLNLKEIKALHKRRFNYWKH